MGLHLTICAHRTTATALKSSEPTVSRQTSYRTQPHLSTRPSPAFAGYRPTFTPPTRTTFRPSSERDAGGGGHGLIWNKWPHSIKREAVLNCFVVSGYFSAVVSYFSGHLLATFCGKFYLSDCQGRMPYRDCLAFGALCLGRSACDMIQGLVCRGCGDFCQQIPPKGKGPPLSRVAL